MTDHKILILRFKFNKFHFWSNFNKSGKFQRFQNYIQNFSRMHIAESPCLKSIFAIWGSGERVLLRKNIFTFEKSFQAKSQTWITKKYFFSPGSTITYIKIQRILLKAEYKRNFFIIHYALIVNHHERTQTYYICFFV